MADETTFSYTTGPLDVDTWDDFARLVEANNGVWGGCWCMGFHPEGVGMDHPASQNREPTTSTYATERSVVPGKGMRGRHGIAGVRQSAASAPGRLS